jgi:hypothetical protein
MRELGDYSMREWLRLKPLDHFTIQVCNDALQGIFRKLHPRALERFLQDAEHLAGGNVGLVIAYQQPWALDWLLRMADRHLVDGALLVFDNSRRSEARREIERICRDRGVPYLALPPNPTWHPNRSHGMAMTWIFHNVVRALNPRIFSFIDHDLIPMDKTVLGGNLGDQPFYGALKFWKYGWSLWAGYCSFDFTAVHHLPLNFLNDFSRGLDTGGRNWSLLYRNFDRDQLRFAPREYTEFADPLDGAPHPTKVVDGSWIHLGGASYSGKFRERFAFYERVAKATDEGATLKTLIMK